MKSRYLQAFLKHTSENARETVEEMLLVLFYWRCVLLAFVCENSPTTNDDLDFNSCTLLLNEGLEYLNKFLQWKRIIDLNVSFMEKV